jgi:hypothetical protein
MPYVPRPATTAQCAHCGADFEKKHASRKYCSNSCNVQASYARTGYRAEGRPSRADLEQAVARMTELVELVTGKPQQAGKAAATKSAAPIAKATATKPKPAKKAVSTVKKGITTPAPAAKAAATKPKKKKTAPVAKLVPFVDVSPAEVKAIRKEVEENDASAGGMNIPDEVDRLIKREVARRRRAAGLPKI